MKGKGSNMIFCSFRDLKTADLSQLEFIALPIIQFN